MIHIWHWFLSITGSNNTSGTWYGFWSGFGSDLGLIAGFGTIVYKQIQHHKEQMAQREQHHKEILKKE